MLPPPTCNSERPTPAEVVEPADEKLLVTNTSHEPEEQRPQRRVRIILPREVCTDPETAAKIMHGEIQKALEMPRPPAREVSEGVKPELPRSSLRTVAATFSGSCDGFVMSSFGQGAVG